MIMSFINCPECGKENVRDRALSCPSCGFVICNDRLVSKCMIELDDNSSQQQEKNEVAV